MKKVLSVIIILLGFTASVTNGIYAQITSSGIAISAPVSDSKAGNGDIICSYKDGYKRCNKEYDTSIVGVISDNPAAEINDPDLKNKRLIITSGIAQVKVTTINGSIKEGDFITSSVNEGVGQKALRNGYVIGTSIQDYDNQNKSAVGTIQIMIGIHPEAGLTGTRGNLIQFIRQGLAVPVFEPVEALRYLLAVAIVLISFTLGMIYFGKASRAGIEAVGRNPLAKNVIQFTVIMNITLTIVIVLVGLGIAWLILIL